MEEDQLKLLAADSFRVRRNPDTARAEVRGWRLHLERFRRGVREAAPMLTTQALESFLAESAEAVMRFGEGFPRLELWGGAGSAPELSLSLRPLPNLTTEIELRTAPDVVLDTPGRKGPNIARLAELNHKLGGEALLVDQSGLVREGSTTSLIWWNPTGQTGYVVADHTRRVDSVTERLLQQEAELVPSSVSPQALSRHEVWAVNALHGIRIVTSVDGLPTRHPKLERLAQFRKALDLSWAPVLPFPEAGQSLIAT